MWVDVLVEQRGCLIRLSVCPSSLFGWLVYGRIDHQSHHSNRITPKDPLTRFGWSASVRAASPPYPRVPTVISSVVLVWALR